MSDSVTRLGDFGKFMAINSATKVTQIYDNFLGNYKKHKFLSKTGTTPLWAAYGNFRQLFIPTSGHTEFLCPPLDK